jgi:hypothetical protein
MFTESSKPTIAKNARPVAAMTPVSTDLSPVSNSVTREKSPSPIPSAQTPIPMMISSPLSSTQVSTTLAFTLSPTPRKFTSATRVMKPSPIRVMPMPSPRSRPKTLAAFALKARAAVDADVMPELITAKATRNVRKWMPNALCVYSAAPAACGYLVTSSR